MNQMTDLELCEFFSKQICGAYEQALEFMDSAPDVSLVKFRTISEWAVTLVAEKQNYEFETTNLQRRIDELFDIQAINKQLRSQLHDVRKLGNDGAHANLLEDEIAAEKQLVELRGKAVSARKYVLLSLEDIYVHVFGQSLTGNIEITENNSHTFRDIIFEATFKKESTAKKNAGIAYERLIQQQVLKNGYHVRANDYHHLSSLTMQAIALLDTAAILSYFEVFPEQEMEQFSKEEIDEAVLEHGDVDALHAYSRVVFGDSFLPKEMHEKALGRTKAAADRGYPPAMTTYGRECHTKKDYEGAWRYLTIAAEADDAEAIACLSMMYSDGWAGHQDVNKGLELAQHATDLGHPEGLLALGRCYLLGLGVQQDDKKAQELIEQAVGKGSLTAKRYLEKIVHEKQLTQIAKQKADQIYLETGKAVLETLKKTRWTNIAALGKVGRNDLCPCGSGKKYKKCCGA